MNSIRLLKQSTLSKLGTSSRREPDLVQATLPNLNERQLWPASRLVAMRSRRNPTSVAFECDAFRTQSSFEKVAVSSKSWPLPTIEGGRAIGWVGSNNRVNTDRLFRCALKPSGYGKR